MAIELDTTPYRDYGYQETAHWDPSFAAYVVDAVARLKGVSTICELGCGNGALAHIFAERGYQLTAIDASRTGIEQASNIESTATFVCDKIDTGLADRLGLHNTFDMVLSSEVIEHLYRPSDLLEVASLLLRPRGWLVLTTPYHGYLKYLALALSGKMDHHLNPNWEGGHIKFFSPSSLRILASEHGYQEQSFSYYGRFFALWKSMILTARAPG